MGESGKVIVAPCSALPLGRNRRQVAANDHCRLNFDREVHCVAVAMRREPALAALNS